MQWRYCSLALSLLAQDGYDSCANALELLQSWQHQAITLTVVDFTTINVNVVVFTKIDSLVKIEKKKL